MLRNDRLSRRRTFAAVVSAALTMAALFATLVNSVAQAQKASAAGPFAVYLPLSQSSQTSAPPPTSTPPPAATGGSLFMQPAKKTAGAQIKIDPQGGMHMVSYDAVPLAQNPGANYGYCPPPSSQCTDPAKWTYLSNIGDQIDEVQLQLTPQGQPRLLIGYHSLQYSSEFFFYGECNSNCTVMDSWDFVQVGEHTLGISFDSVYTPRRSFALDPQGRPAFVVYDSNYAPEPDHAGGYYYSCQSSCLDIANWSEALFTLRNNGYNELISKPVLKFTSTGAPRILGEFYPLNGQGESGIYYFACDSNCESADGWERARIAERINGPNPAWDLEFDSQDRPRVAYFAHTSSQTSVRHLFYLSCDSNCLSGNLWQSTDMGVPNEEGIDPDLVLDSANRPRVAFLASTALGYAWCDGNCATSAGWQHGYGDTDSEMTADYPIPLPYTCSSGIWDSHAPSLALDAQGNPRMAYDASYEAYCQFQDPADPGAPIQNKFIEIWHAVRTVIVPKP